MSERRLDRTRQCVKQSTGLLRRTYFADKIRVFFRSARLHYAEPDKNEIRKLY